MYTLFSENRASSQTKINCAIFSAMPEELEALHDSFSHFPSHNYEHKNFNFIIYDIAGFKILLTPTGIGTTFAASVVMMVSTLFQLDSMFFIGTAGGIHDTVGIRDLILVESCFEAELQNLFPALEGTPFASCLIHPLKKEKIQQKYFAHPQLLQLATSINTDSIYTGTVVSSNTFPAPQELFSALKNENVLAIDMETSAFYQIAWLLGIPAIAIRAISNKLDYTGQDKDIGSSDIKGSIKIASDYLIQLIDTIRINNLLINTESLEQNCFTNQPS